MNLSKALKLKNRLAGEISRLRGLVSSYNSIERVGGQGERECDIDVLISDLKDRQEQIVKVKTSIAICNSGGDIEKLKETNTFRIYLLAELKGEIEFLKGLNTIHGVKLESHFGSENPIQRTYSSKIRDKDVTEAVITIQRTIDKIQDEMDEFNASTDVSVLGEIKL